MLPLAGDRPFIVRAGYTSVAHYLVLNNLSDAAKPVALERGMCPPELAGMGVVAAVAWLSGRWKPLNALPM